jgi:hypothetical protein
VTRQPPPPPAPPVDICGSALQGHDGAKPKVDCPRTSLPNTTQAECCAACSATPCCRTWVRDTFGGVCWLLKSSGNGAIPAVNRTVGGHLAPATPAGFTPTSLRVESVAGTGAPSFSWKFGDMDSGNLLGTARSLDGVTGSIDLNCR